MEGSISILKQPITRRRFLKAGIYGAAGLALYSGEIARHWIQVTHHDMPLAGLSPVFDGMKIVQLSDIHMDEYTESFFLRRVVDRINQLQPDAVFLTGDYVSTGPFGKKYAVRAAWVCAGILKDLKCRQLYAILGNHDIGVGADEVMEALTTNGITVLRNTCLPIERAGSRFWLAGTDDPVMGNPDLELAVPRWIRNVPNEPIVLMVHAPDYANFLLDDPASKAVHLMLSGHTHGGQIRLPVIGPLYLPGWGRRYVEGWFHLGGWWNHLSLYVNRGIGTVGVPFRLNCPPEITLFTLRTA
ncbi:MAG: metallophosphoesterase [Terracidiphilus sp.]